jgi:WD40 repeat protein
MDNCPYKGLVPYGEEDVRYFFGRDIERRIIADNLRATRLTVLSGPSGAGKSSVLRAGVANDLRSDLDYAVIIFDSWQGDPLASLDAAVQQKMEEILGHSPKDKGSSNGGLVARLESYARSVDRTLLIALDQFEAYFQYHPSDTDEAGFAAQFPSLVNRKELPVHLLLSLRDDSLWVLDRFKSEVPALWDNRLSITYLSREAAREAIIKPLETFNKDLQTIGYRTLENNLHAIEIENELAAQVVEEIVAAQGEEQQGVQTAYLQLVMTRWWEREIADGSAKMRSETLRKFGGVTAIVGRHLEDTLATLSLDERRLAVEVFRYMVTPTGRKIAQVVSDLAGATWIVENVSRQVVGGLLERLQKARVLTSIPPPRGSRPDEKCYEFAHDVVAKAALEWRKQFSQAEELAEAKKREQAANQEAFAQARQARKLRRLVLALAVMVLLAFAAILGGLLERVRGRIHESAVASRAVEDTDPELSVLIATQGVAAAWRWSRSDLPEAEEQLHRSLLASHVRLTLSSHRASVRSAAWSPDGKRLATGGDDSVSKVWDAASGKELLTLSGHGGPVLSVAWRPDSQRLATASDDKTAKVWDPAGGQELLTLSGHGGPVRSVAWSPDGKQLATASDDKTAKVWDPAGGQELLTLSGHGGPVRSVAWSPDGKQLATASDDKTAKVWDAKTGKQSWTLRGHTQLVNSVTWSPDGKWLATGSWDHTVKVWNAITGRIVPIQIEADGIPSVAWSARGKRLATGSWLHAAYVWQADTGKNLLVLKGHADIVLSVAWSPDGQRLVTGSGDHTAKVWDAAESGKELLALSQEGSVWQVVWSPDGKRLATAYGGETARIWDAETGKGLLTVSGHGGLVRSVAWSPDGQRLATASEDKTAKVWDAASGKELLTLSGHEGPVRRVAWSPDGKRLATASEDKTAKVWDAASGEKMLTLSGHGGPIRSIAWSPDSQRLATASEDKTVKVWDAAGGRELLTLSGHGGPVRSVAWSPDGKRLATASEDRTAKVWDTTSGYELLTLGGLRGHSVAVSSVAWSPDGKQIATASDDKTAKIWDAKSAEELMTLGGNSAAVLSVAWSPDGKRLATGSADWILQVYAMDLWNLMALARQRVTAHPSEDGCKQYLRLDRCPPIPELSFW